MTTCHVCNEAIDDSNSATCNTCDNPFHLCLRNDAEGKDCGEVWINEQYLALEFACFTCLGKSKTTEAAAEEPPVGSGH